MTAPTTPRETAAWLAERILDDRERSDMLAAGHVAAILAGLADDLPHEDSPLPESDEYRREVALQRAVEQTQTWPNQSSEITVRVARTFEAYLRGER